MPWGLGRWGGWTLLFLLLLLLFLLLFCLPRRTTPPAPPVPPTPVDTVSTPPEPEPEPEPDPDEPIPHTGDVQVLLEWDTYDDVDLHVIDPAGEEIYFGHRRSRSGGELDIDANAGSNMMRNPKENVFWPVGGAPMGRYKVRVRWFAQNTSETSVPYRVMVKYGEHVENYSGTLRRVSQFNNVCTFVLE